MAKVGDLDGPIAVLREVGNQTAVATRVTNDNVNQREFADWILNYLRTHEKSEPIFRNGWRITVSGSAAEGIEDTKAHLGAAVMVEMKR